MSDYNIGNIYAELSMDTTNLEASKKKAIKELGNLRDEGAKILKEAGGKMTEAMKIRLEEIEKNKGAILKSIEDLNKKIREKLNPQKDVLGKQIESALMQPLKAFASASVGVFTDFQQSMQNTFSVMGASASEMKLLEDTAKKMGETTRFSASQASSALYALGSAGQNASEAVNSLQGVLKLAGATGSELGYTSETIASTLSQFNLEASKASHIADVYAKAISKSQANMTKLSYSMKYVGPVASGLGISLETTTAALMKLYNTGYGGEQAGTYLKQAFQKLASGTDDLKEKLKELGLSYADVNPQTKSFADIITTLKDKNVGVTESINIFGETAGGAMAKLIEEGGEAIATMEGLLKNSEGAAQEMQEIQNASFANTKAELLSAMEAVQITVGSILEPALNIITTGFTQVLKTLNSLPVGVQTFITTVLTASTAIVPFLTMPALIMKIKGAFDLLNATMLHNPIFIGGAVLAGLATVAYSFHNHIKKQNELLLAEATKGVKDIQEMQAKAKEASEKANNIQSLLDNYEMLRSKTNKTKEEQERYNETLKKLSEMVPGVVISINETGQAYIENANKIKATVLDQLKLSKELNKSAIEIAQYRYQIAEKEAEKIREKNKLNEHENKQIQKKIDLMYKYGNSISEYKKKLKEGTITNTEKDELKKILDEIQREVGNITVEQDMSGFTTGLEVSLNRALENYESFEEKALQKHKDFTERRAKDLEVESQVQKTLQELQLLRMNDTELESLIDSNVKKDVKKAKSKLEIVAEYKTQREEKLKTILKDNRLTLKELDAEREELKLIEEDLKKIQTIAEDDILEKKAFEKSDEELKELYKRKQTLENLLKPKTNTKKETVTEIETNTLYKELEKLDNFYNAKLELAKQYGKDELIILEEYEKQRLELLEKYQKELGDNQNIFSDKDVKNPKNITAEEKAKMTVTIADEIAKTHNIAMDFIEKSEKEHKEKLKELEKVLKEIATLKEKINSIKEKKTQTEADIEKSNIYNNLLSSLHIKAKELSNELKKDYVLLEDIDYKIAELDQKDTNSFTMKFKAIREHKEATIKAIKEAESLGNIDSNVAEQKIKKIKQVALKATVTVGAELTKTILTVGNDVTDLILNAVERGNISLLEGINMALQVGGKIADMIPDPTTKAVVGAVSLGFGLITKLINYAERKTIEAEEKERKRREEEKRESEEKSNKLAGDSASRIAKQTQAVKQGLINYNHMMEEMANKLQQNNINNVLQNMGNEKSLYKENREGVRAIKEGWFFGLGTKVLMGYEKYLYEYNFTINELIAKISEAKNKGDKKLQKELEKTLQKSIELKLKQKGVDIDELNSFHNYLQGLESVFIQAVKNKDFESLRLAMRDKIREAMWAKLQESIILSKLKPLFMELEKAGFEEKEKVIDKIMKESESITQELDNYASKVFGQLGGVPSELEKHQKAWNSLKGSIQEALSNSLAESAYNADWESFKKAFASEMKKAIISSAVANYGLKGKIDNIIKEIMKDGTITADEINDSIDNLQSYFDQMEGKLAPLARLTKALEGGVNVRSSHQGTIIQQLSGADRDYFAEEFRKNFSNMKDNFKSAMLDLKEIHQAQITVMNATLQVRDININGSNISNLKELISEMIEEARNAG